jgi:hypothetical protein
MEELVMKRNLAVFTLLSLCLVAIMVFSVSCGDDDDDDNGTSPTTLFDVTGTWEASGPGLGLWVLHLVQDAQGNITGTVDRASAAGGWDNGTVTSGSNTNNNITINILFDDQMTLELTGTASDANNMSGTYRSYYDPNSVDTDVWSATRSAT